MANSGSETLFVPYDRPYRQVLPSTVTAPDGKPTFQKLLVEITADYILFSAGVRNGYSAKNHGRPEVDPFLQLQNRGTQPV